MAFFVRGEHMHENNNTLNEYVKQEIKNKLYKYTIWFSTNVKLKDRNKMNAISIIYKEMFSSLYNRRNYKTYKAFETIFLNFYILYKRNEKARGTCNEITVHMNKAYYTEHESYTNIPDILRILKDNDYIQLVNTPFFNEDISNTHVKGECSKFIILDKLKEMIIKFIDLCGGSGGAIVIEDEVKPIVLRKDEEYVDSNGKKRFRKTDTKFVETSVIKKMKKHVLAFNKMYKVADIGIDIEQAESFLNEYNTKKFVQEYNEYKWKRGDTEESVVKTIMDKNIYASMPDLSRNQVYRVFTDTFKKNGRLHGLWLHNTKREIQGMVKINGNTTIGLDMAACHPNILASLEGKQITGDFYDIPVNELNIFKTHGVKQEYIVNKDRIRKYVKLCVLTMINCKDEDEYFNAMKARGMYKIEAMNILNLFKIRYEWLEKHVCKSKGVLCMYHESNIMNNIMVKAMLNNNIILLPMYDGLIVEEQYKECVLNIIKQCWKEYFGTNIEITEK